MARVGSGGDFTSLMAQFKAAIAKGEVTPEAKKALGALNKVAVGEADKRAVARAVDTAPISAEQRRQLWLSPELKGVSDFRVREEAPQLVSLQPALRHTPLKHGGIEKVRADDPVSPNGGIEKIRADDPVSPNGGIEKVRADDPV